MGILMRPSTPLFRFFGRWGVFAIFLAGFAVLCYGSYWPGTTARTNRRLSARKIIQLPEPSLTGSISFEQALAEHRAARQFPVGPIGFPQIGQLAWAGQGTVEPALQIGSRLSAVPLENQESSVKLYFAIADGLYLYNSDGHGLEQILREDVRSTLATATSNSYVVAGSGCDIIIAGPLRAFSGRQASDAKRVVLLQAGQIAQNIQLQAVTLELGSVPIGDFDVRSVKRICSLSRNLEPLYIICVGSPSGQVQSVQQGQSATAQKVVLIIAAQGFRDEELFETKRILDAAGLQTTIASTVVGPVIGVLGSLAEATLLTGQLSVDDYDAIVFIGGPGAAQYFIDPLALNIARQAVRRGKVLGAISIAPGILANAGVLRGIRATSFPSEQTRLIQAGAVYTGAVVQRDGSVITAIGPTASVQFGRVIADALAGR